MVDGVITLHTHTENIIIWVVQLANDFWAYAKGPCTVASITRETVYRSWDGQSQLASRVNSATDSTVEINTRGCLVVQCATAVKCAITHPDGMQIRMTRQEIGLIVGCSREMVGRAIKALAQEGAIEVNGKNIVVRGTR